jgi:hypothetical protein
VFKKELYFEQYFYASLKKKCMSKKLIFTPTPGRDIEQYYNEEAKHTILAELQTAFSIQTEDELEKYYERVVPYSSQPTSHIAFYLDANPDKLICVVTKPHREEGQYSFSIHTGEHARRFLTELPRE